MVSLWLFIGEAVLLFAMKGGEGADLTRLCNVVRAVHEGNSDLQLEEVAFFFFVSRHKKE